MLFLSQFFFFFFKQKTAYEIEYGLVGSEMCIRDRCLSPLIPCGPLPEPGPPNLLLLGSVPTAAAERGASTCPVTRARFGALGSIDTADGSPSVSRVSLATAMDGAPGFLISRLSSHFGNLDSDERCSLLVGEPGKGDSPAHARMTITGHARRWRCCMCGRRAPRRGDACAA